MKLRNLFLAGLAAIAMASCSNEIEGVDNGNNNVEKNAKLQFSIGFPGVTTRANTGDEELGTDEENNIKTINVRVSYSEGISDDIFNFKIEDFNKGEGNTYTLKEEKYMTVAPSEGATLYVTVNGDKEVTITGTTTAEYDATEASIKTGLAEANNFLMSGKSKEVVTITQNKVNQAEVEVDRVAARIDEVTTTKDHSFDLEFITKYKDQDGTIKNIEAQSLTATVVDYALYNLNEKTNIFASTTFAADPTYFQEFVPTTKNTLSYDGDFVSREIGATSTYTLENNSETNPTSIIYKVQYKYTGEEKGTGDFFTYVKGENTVVYKDFASLDTDNDYRFSKSFGLDKNSEYSAFIKAGVTKYTAGIAYYTKEIKTNNSDTKILRNNCYKLNVSKISGLGTAVIDPEIPGEPTLLELTVSVKSWTVNVNDFELN